MICKRFFCLLVGVTVVLASTFAWSAEIHGTSSTQYGWFTDVFSGNKQAEFGEYLNLSITKIDTDGKLSIQGYGRVTEDVMNGNGDNGRLYYLYADYSNLYDKVDLRFAFPGLPGDDARGHADRLRDGERERSKPFRPALDPRQRLERQHDQRITGQHRERFAERPVNRWTAAPPLCRVEAGQIVVHQRRAMQQFKRGTGGFRGGRMVLAAGRGHAVTQPRPNPRAPGEDRVAHGFREARWTARDLRKGDRFAQGPLDPAADIHGQAPCLSEVSFLIVIFQCK